MLIKIGKDIHIAASKQLTMKLYFGLVVAIGCVVITHAQTRGNNNNQGYPSAERSRSSSRGSSSGRSSSSSSTSGFDPALLLATESNNRRGSRGNMGFPPPFSGGMPSIGGMQGMPQNFLSGTPGTSGMGLLGLGMAGLDLPSFMEMNMFSNMCAAMSRPGNGMSRMSNNRGMGGMSPTYMMCMNTLMN